jgi:acyl-CoA thioesterase-1
VLALAWATSHDVFAEGRVVRIVVLGDSVIENKGVPVSDRFPDKLESLKARGQSVAVANAGLVTDTAARGLARLDRVITDDTDGVILVLGTNDMLWGIDPKVTRTALAAILSQSRSPADCRASLESYLAHRHSAV